FTPDRGAAGTTITITGTNFTGTSLVKFGGTASTFSVLSPTSIKATVPAAAITGPVSVSTASGSSASSGSFTVLPSMSVFTPSSGAVGASVVIMGGGFSGATEVKFGNVNATYTVLSAISIKATVPIGAITSPVTVTTPSGSVLSKTNFMVVPGIG